MSGHSKWANIKFRKEIKDNRRGSLFTKLANAVTIAVREKGPDPETNFKLRLAIQKAKDANLPTENIARAIKRGSGELEGVKLEELIYEAYGPGGTAFLISATTDNKNRTSSEIKKVLTQNNGRLTGSGSVAWMFAKKGLIRLATENQNREQLELTAIDSGADDVQEEEDNILVYTQPENLENIKKNLEKQNLKILSAELSTEPKNVIKIADIETAQRILKLMAQLDEIAEVSQISANFDIPDKLIEKEARK